MVKLYSWFKSHVPLFLGMVMYGYEVETKENKIQNKDKIELQQIHLSYIAFTRRATCTLKQRKVIKGQWARTVTTL